MRNKEGNNEPKRARKQIGRQNTEKVQEYKMKSNINANTSIIPTNKNEINSPIKKARLGAFTTDTTDIKKIIWYY